MEATSRYELAVLPSLLAVCFAVGSVFFLRSLHPEKLPRKKKDVLESILQFSAPEAAKKELDSLSEGERTCECLLGTTNFIITKDPQLADYIFNGPSRGNYVRRPAANEGLNELGMFERGLIWNNNIPIWKDIRGVFQMALNGAAIKKAVGVINDEALLLLDAEVKKDVDFIRFGVDETAMIEAIVAYFKAWEYYLLRPQEHWDSEFTRKHLSAVNSLQNQVRRLLVASENREKATKSTAEKTAHMLFIDHLRKVCQSHPDSQTSLEQGVLEMLLAGTDTSSVTAYYTLLGLAGDISLQKDLREELRLASEVGPKHCPLLDSVIDEVLRFKPVGPVVLREAVKADPDFPKGIAMEQGTAILIHLAEMNRCSDLWTDPASFNPKRFLGAPNAITGTMESKFFPFGNGPKGCIGMHLGRREVSAIVRTVVLNYDMQVVGGDDSLDSIETHWDIANQPDKPSMINIRKV